MLQNLKDYLPVPACLFQLMPGTLIAQSRDVRLAVYRLAGGFRLAGVQIWHGRPAQLGEFGCDVGLGHGDDLYGAQQVGEAARW